MKKYFIAGNRAFVTYAQASEYCEENDFDGETMITEVTDQRRREFENTVHYRIHYK